MKRKWRKVKIGGHNNNYIAVMWVQGGSYNTMGHLCFRLIRSELRKLGKRQGEEKEKEEVNGEDPEHKNKKQRK